MIGARQAVVETIDKHLTTYKENVMASTLKSKGDLIKKSEEKAKNIYIPHMERVLAQMGRKEKITILKYTVKLPLVISMATKRRMLEYCKRQTGHRGLKKLPLHCADSKIDDVTGPPE